MKYSLFLLKILLQCYQRSKYRKEFAIIFNKSPRNISNSPFSLWTSWKFVWSCHAILFFRSICVDMNSCSGSFEKRQKETVADKEFQVIHLKLVSQSTTLQTIVKSIFSNYCQEKLWRIVSMLLIKRSHPRCSVKKMSSKVSQNSQENTCIGISI